MSKNQRIRRNAKVLRGSCEVALVILALSAGCRTDDKQGDAGSAPVSQSSSPSTTQTAPSDVREPSEDSLILDLGGGVTMDLVRIEPGTFLMGLPESDTRYSFILDYEGPQHRVGFGNPFFLGKYEVTQAQWKAVMDNNPSAFRGDELPVEQVSWNDCREFCRRLSQRTGTHLHPTVWCGVSRRLTLEPTGQPGWDPVGCRPPPPEQGYRLQGNPPLQRSA